MPSVRVRDENDEHEFGVWNRREETGAGEESRKGLAEFCMEFQYPFLHGSELKPFLIFHR